MAGSTFKVCKDQTYALCAAARCDVYDGVAYALPELASVIGQEQMIRAPRCR
jgi:hypothetical protein